MRKPRRAATGAPIFHPVVGNADRCLTGVMWPGQVRLKFIMKDTAAATCEPTDMHHILQRRPRNDVMAGAFTPGGEYVPWLPQTQRIRLRRRRLRTHHRETKTFCIVDCNARRHQERARLCLTLQAGPCG